MIKTKAIVLTLVFSFIILKNISSDESPLLKAEKPLLKTFDFQNHPENDFSAENLKAYEICHKVNKTNNRTALISRPDANPDLINYLRKRMINVYIKEPKGDIKFVPGEFKKIGHRGSADAICPFTENTKKAFSWAINNGADCIETDLRITADKTVVIMHDITTKRTMDKELSVESSEISKLYSLKYKENEKLLTFQRYLEYAKENNILTFAELKGSDLSLPHKALELVKLYNMENNVCFISFNYNFLAEIRKQNKEITLGLLVTNYSYSSLKLAKSLNAFYNPPATAMNLSSLKELYKKDIPVVLYTSKITDEIYSYAPFINAVTANVF